MAALSVSIECVLERIIFVFLCYYHHHSLDLCSVIQRKLYIILT